MITEAIAADSAPEQPQQRFCIAGAFGRGPRRIHSGSGAQSRHMRESVF
jgi:hypothetical protein